MTKTRQRELLREHGELEAQVYALRKRQEEIEDQLFPNNAMPLMATSKGWTPEKRAKLSRSMKAIWAAKRKASKAA